MLAPQEPRMIPHLFWLDHSLILPDVSKESQCRWSARFAASNSSFPTPVLHSIGFQRWVSPVVYSLTIVGAQMHGRLVLPR